MAGEFFPGRIITSAFQQLEIMIGENGRQKHGQGLRCQFLRTSPRGRNVPPRFCCDFSDGNIQSIRRWVAEPRPQHIGRFKLMTPTKGVRKIDTSLSSMVGKRAKQTGISPRNANMPHGIMGWSVDRCAKYG